MESTQHSASTAALRPRRARAACWIAASLLIACSSDPAPTQRASAGAGGTDAAGASAAQESGGQGGSVDEAGATSTGGSAGTQSDVGGASGASAGTSGNAGSDGGSPDFANGLTPPDPNVTFEWTASLPGDGDCRPGRYAGTFSCDYFQVPTDPLPLVTVTGPVSITLEESQDGEFLEIADGKLEGFAQLIIGFRAQLEGRLDCRTRTLDATAVDGLYGFGDPALLPFGMFEGALGGQLDPATAVLDGDWNLTVTGGGVCRGPWQANWAP